MSEFSDNLPQIAHTIILYQLFRKGINNTLMAINPVKAVLATNKPVISKYTNNRTYIIEAISLHLYKKVNDNNPKATHTPPPKR